MGTRTAATSTMAAKGSAVRAAEYHDHDFDFEERVPVGQLYDAELAAWKETRKKHVTHSGGGRGTEHSEPSTSVCCDGVDPHTTNDAIEKSWETFHSRNKGHFFKSRRYLTLAFPLLLNLGRGTSDSTDLNSNSSAGSRVAVSGCSVSCVASEDRPVDPCPTPSPTAHVVELGCGCGSTILTLLLSNPWIRATAVDISPSAIERLQKLLVENKLGGWCSHQANKLLH